MSYNYLPLDRKWLHFQQIKNLLEFNQLVSITFDAHERILKCREYVDSKLSSGDRIFDVLKTGSFLSAADVSKTAEGEANVLKSHACGVGEEVPIDIVKLMLMLKIKALSWGHSGVDIETVKRLMDMYNNEVIPVIYTQGSAGLGGDTTPLSHLSLPLIGSGNVYYKGSKRSSTEVLNELNWKPLQLKANESAALATGTQFTTAYGMYCLQKAEQLIKMANLIAALSFDTFDCSTLTLHEKLHSLRSFNGQVSTAATLRSYLDKSGIATGQKEDVADPYSFSCIAQVHGATQDTFGNVLGVFLKEINSVTESPTIFPEDDMVLSGGNFHGQPLAQALDFLNIALTGLAIISERRTHQLLSGQRGLPMSVMKNAGVKSGFIVLHNTAGTLVSEIKGLCTPASIGNISTNMYEDNLTNSAKAATACLRISENVEKVLGIELLTAVQALEFRRPLRSSPALEEMAGALRQQVPVVDTSSAMRDYLIKAVGFLQSYPGRLNTRCEKVEK